MKKLKIGVLYLLLGAGGLWHILGVFQGTMRILASPMMFGLGIWLFWECFRVYPQQERRKFVLWSIGVIVGSFGIEWLGVQTGHIFGAYVYGQTLRPSIDGVPLSIGCAWFVMLIASVAVVQRVAPKSVTMVNYRNKFIFANVLYHKLLVCGLARFLPHPSKCKNNSKIYYKSTLKLALCVALLMVFFDLFMEPAAGMLDYWTWVDSRIPLQNYLAWFGLSFIFAIIGIGVNLFSEPLPRIAFHFYFAQLIYFGLVDLKYL